MDIAPNTVDSGDQPASTMADSNETAQFITFTLGAEEYGVDIMAVKEIKGWTATTSIPKSPSYVRGVINLRGVIVPIFDLRARFGMGATETTKSHVVIIINVGVRVMGLLVDAVSDILTVTRTDIRPVPDMDRRADEGFLDGLVAIEERMVTLISLSQLFQGEAGNAADAAKQAGEAAVH